MDGTFWVYRNRMVAGSTPDRLSVSRAKMSVADPELVAATVFPTSAAGIGSRPCRP